MEEYVSFRFWGSQVMREKQAQSPGAGGRGRDAAQFGGAAGGRRGRGWDAVALLPWWRDAPTVKMHRCVGPPTLALQGLVPAHTPGQGHGVWPK